MNPSINAIIFDVDGTLLDTETLSSGAVNTELEKFNAAPIDWDLKRRIIGLPGPSWTEMVIRERGLESFLTPYELELKWDANLHAICSSVVEIEGATKLIDSLRALPLKLAVATSSRKEGFMHKALNHQKLFSTMEVIVCGDDSEVYLLGMDEE